MPVTETVYTARFADDDPLRVDYDTDEVQFTFDYKVFTDVTPFQKYVVWMQGSAGDAPPTAAHELIVALTGAGYTVFSPGYDIAPYDPYRYGYGNVNEPQVLSRWIKAAWALEGVLRAGDPVAPLADGPTVILGTSLGATAALAWAAGYHRPEVALSAYGHLRGIIADGATMAGLGDNRWNDMNRTLGELGQMVALNRVPEKTLLTYGAADDLAPPDMQQRLRLAVPDAMRMLHRSGGGHAWMAEGADNAAIAVRWVDELISGDAITLEDGLTEAAPGASGGLTPDAGGGDYGQITSPATDTTDQGGI